MEKYSIGIDLGGTKILAGIVEKQSGKVIFEVKNKTKKEKGNKKIGQKILETLDELIKEGNISRRDIISVGIGLAGQVDRKNGILINAANLECVNFNVKELIEKKFKIETFAGNDVEVAALGELKYGAGRGFKDIICIFVGTGIGSSLIKDGKLHYGANGSAGEIGHMIVDLNGRACTCGGHGCLEAYASRSAIESRILGAIKKGRASIITDFADSSSISSKHIKKSLDARDEIVTQYVNEAIEYLSGGIASVINFYNPELVILGGGLIQSIDDFYLGTIKKARVKALPVPAGTVKFKKAELDDYSGVIGASMLSEWRQQTN